MDLREGKESVVCKRELHEGGLDLLLWVLRAPPSLSGTIQSKPRSLSLFSLPKGTWVVVAGENRGRSCRYLRIRAERTTPYYRASCSEGSGQQQVKVSDLNANPPTALDFGGLGPQFF